MTDQQTNVSDLTEAAESVKERASETIHESIASIQANLDALSAQAGEGLRGARDESTQFVRNNPGTALLGAVGLGILIGMAVKQR